MDIIIFWHSPEIVRFGSWWLAGAAGVANGGSGKTGVRHGSWRGCRRRAFTLLELLLVLVILTALAGVVVPRFAQRSEQARITAALTDIAALEIAIDTFEIDTGRYPSSEEGLRALVERPTDVRQWNGPYIRRGVPRDPWGNYYNYRQPGLHNSSSYDLWSYGPDEQDGTDDDIDNWSER